MDTLTNPCLSRYAKFCVAMVLLLILLGAFVTTYDAGMAVPTWPTIHGDVNPSGWWKDHLVLLEHSHRMVAALIGLFVGILCAWIWGNCWALGVAAGVSGLCRALATALHLDGNLSTQLMIWPAAIVFVAFLIFTHRRSGGKVTGIHKLVLIVFFCVCVQAVMGGYRVMLETGGNDAVKAANAELALGKDAAPDVAAAHKAKADELGAKAQALYPLATDLRVVHGIFAQITLCLLVILATLLSPISRALSAGPPHAAARKIKGMAIGAIALYFIQLSLGAYIRHHNIGLLISTWPGGWPSAWTGPVVIHFLHSRVMPFLIFGHFTSMGISCVLRAKGEGRLVRPGIAILVLTIAQIVFGVIIVTKGGRLQKPHAANSHVVNGALILSTAALLAVRAKLLVRRESAAPMGAAA